MSERNYNISYAEIVSLMSVVSVIVLLIIGRKSGRLDN